ncbi:hypothetical protein Goshw_012816, partial [Gossypium schwendimanii]|nr:hypothetical protein [Gossypium schwendimanii]
MANSLSFTSVCSFNTCNKPGTLMWISHSFLFNRLLKRIKVLNQLASFVLIAKEMVMKILVNYFF